MEFDQMQVVIDWDWSAIFITQEGFLALRKWITILRIRNF